MSPDRSYVRALAGRLTLEQREQFNARLGAIDAMDESQLHHAKLVLEEVVTLTGLSQTIMRELKQLREQTAIDKTAMFVYDLALLLSKHLTWNTERVSPEALANHVRMHLMAVLTLLQ